jgi:hypothetical protein
MKLLQMQQKFSPMVARLILKAEEMGYKTTLGDAFRDPRAFGEIGVKKAYGHPSSGHKKHLAIDLNLHKDGKYLTQTKDHEPLGLWWESIGGTWGGRFEDGNHYSLEFEGVK